MIIRNNQLKKLIRNCESKGIHVDFVASSKLHDFAAMNWKTAQVFGIKDFPKNTVWIDEKYQMQGKSLQATELENLKHELDEAAKIQHGENYWQAHSEALKQEKHNRVDMPKPEIKIIKRHDDGDLTVRKGRVNYVLTTGGQTFKELPKSRLAKRIMRKRKFHNLARHHYNGVLRH